MYAITRHPHLNTGIATWACTLGGQVFSGLRQALSPATVGVFGEYLDACATALIADAGLRRLILRKLRGELLHATMPLGAMPYFWPSIARSYQMKALLNELLETAEADIERAAEKSSP